jgi:nitrile hydratase accessory protein
MAVALRQSRRYSWPDFQRHLEREIAAAGRDDDGTRYYERWLAAFEALLAERGLVDSAELGRRTHEYLEGVREEVF